MKTFKGKAIYNPSGKAGEYSYWACNFYVGCSNNCDYCYCKKGILSHTMGGTTPMLKKCFQDMNHALQIFEDEILQNIDDLRKYGLFFSFTTDPLLERTIHLTVRAVDICMRYQIPVKILTKCTNWLQGYRINNDYIPFPFMIKDEYKSLIAFGFTLTGHDELESGANTNIERIEAMKKLYNSGFKTFASIEPIIDFESSLSMIKKTIDFCDLYKIGLMSGIKYNKTEAIRFVVNVFLNAYNPAIYIKDSLLKICGDNRESISVYSNSVDRNYNLFNK